MCGCEWCRAVPVCLGYPLILASTLAGVLAFAMPWWATTDSVIDRQGETPSGNVTDVVIGLWQVCQPGQCLTIDTSLLPTWFKMVQALVVGSVGLQIIATILGTSLLCCSRCKDNYVVSQYVVAALVAAFACLVPALIIFSVKVVQATELYGVLAPDFYPSWSFHLDIVTVVLLVPPAVLYFMEGKRIARDHIPYFDIDESSLEEGGGAVGTPLEKTPVTE